MRIDFKHFMKSLKSTLGSTFRFSGRSRRSEVLFFWLAATATGVIPFTLVEFITPVGSISRTVFIISVILLIPFPALLVRRLHDQNRSGWWALAWAPAILMGIIEDGEPTGFPLFILAGLGNLLIIAFLLWPGSIGENRFGSSPRADANFS